MATSRNRKKDQTRREPVKFDEPESRKKFIHERMDTLLDEFGQSYGSFLAEELQKRLEHTIRVFHEDTSDLLTNMVIESNARIEMTDELREGKKLNELVRRPVFKPGGGATQAAARKAASGGASAADIRQKSKGTDRVSTPKSLFQKKKEF